MTSNGGERADTVLLTGLSAGEIVRYLAPVEGMVAEFTLVDGSSSWGVLGSVSYAGLVVERWDSEAGGPNGDVLIVALDRVLRLVVP